MKERILALIVNLKNIKFIFDLVKKFIFKK